MKDFVKTLERIAKDIYDVKQQHKNFSGEVTTPKQDAYLCWICDTELNKSAQDPGQQLFVALDQKNLSSLIQKADRM